MYLIRITQMCVHTPGQAHNAVTTARARVSQTLSQSWLCPFLVVRSYVTLSTSLSFSFFHLEKVDDKIHHLVCCGDWSEIIATVDWSFKMTIILTLLYSVWPCASSHQPLESEFITCFGQRDNSKRDARVDLNIVQHGACSLVFLKPSHRVHKAKLAC